MNRQGLVVVNGRYNRDLVLGQVGPRALNFFCDDNEVPKQ